MLVEHGFSQVTASDGGEWSFTPSLGRVAELGSPAEVVRLFGALHGPTAERDAAYVLAVFCDQPDPFPLIGCHDIAAGGAWRDGLMPPSERAILARHLMRHAMVGCADPGAMDGTRAGEFAAEFNVSAFIAIARVHLGMSAADAEALSMTELQGMLDVKFPRTGEPEITLADLDAAEEAERLREAAHG